jgi:hypothetical protein
MKKFLYLLVLVLVLGVFASSTMAQEQIQQARELIKSAQQCYQEKKYSEYLANLEKALKLRPNHPELIYKCAGANALLGNKKEAINYLNKFAGFGLIANLAEDGDFALIKDSNEFQALIKDIERNRLPKGQGKVVVKLPEKDLITEGLAYDPQEEKFYIGSVRKRKIVTVDKNGQTTDFTSSQQDGLWGVFGLKIDAKRRILWVASSAIAEMNNFDKKEENLAAVFQYDLKTKKLIKKYSLPSDGKRHLFGDLTINSKGDVFITDSFSPNIYQISLEKGMLENFVSGPFASLQGIAFSGDEKQFFISDYSQGIFSIDVATKNITKLNSPDSVTLLGIDGIYFYQNTLLAIQNGVNPQRVIKLSLSDNLKEINGLEVLEVSKALLPDPTLGVIIGNEFCFLANAQWNNFDKVGNILPLDKFTEPTIVQTKLK